MIILTKEQNDKCNKAVPKEHIKTIGSGSFKKVYVSGHYVKHMLNEVFGVGMWSYTYTLNNIKIYDKVFDKEVKKGYLAHVELTIKDKDNNELILKDIGTGELSSTRFNEEDKAIKGAVSDGLKRCAVNIGEAFGLNIMDNKE